MANVSVFRDKFAKGWPRHEHGEPAYTLELGRALERSYSTDAHFAAYETPNNRRLTSEAIGTLDAIELTCIVFDIDCPDTHGTSEPVPEAWRTELREKLWMLSEDHPDPYYYETRGGARIVYRQAEPTLIKTQEDALEWRRTYAIAVAHLASRYGIEADPACSDWQRFYRLPKATRDEGGKPEDRLIIGRANQIGTLELDPGKPAVQAARSASKAFQARRVVNYTPSCVGGDGLLFWLLRGRGLIIRDHGRGAHVVACPCESEHSSGSTGDGSTLLYLPAAGHQVGALHCLHAHCSDRTVREWLALFSFGELDAARRSAGIRAA